MSIHNSPTPTDTDADPPIETTPSISKNELFYILQNSRRRAVLRYLAKFPAQEHFEMRTIAVAIAALENGIPVEQISSAQRQRVYISLYQSHLPALDEIGAIEYNQPRGIVTPTPLTEVFAPYLEKEFRIDATDQRITLPEDQSSGTLSIVRSLLNH